MPGSGLGRCSAPENGAFRLEVMVSHRSGETEDASWPYLNDLKWIVNNTLNDIAFIFKY